VTDGTTLCANSGSGTVTVHALPTVSVNSATICAGASATLTATTSASSPSYLWSPGGATTASITVSPASTATYTVTVTDGTTSCANSGSGTVTVTPLPTVSVNSATVCAGSSATLTATTSASSPTYSWSPGGATTASITVSPASTTTYTVTVTDGTTSCANSGSGTVTVNPLPAVTMDTTNQTACAGSPVTWSVVASGTGLSYQWQRDGTNLVEGVDNFTGTTTGTLTNSAVAAQDGLDAAHGYACVISIGTCSVTSTLASLTVNALPVAPSSNVSYNLSLPFSLKINISDLLTNWTGTSLSVQSVTNSADGGTVTKNSTYIFYTPPTNSSPTSPDTIPYTVSGAGGCATAASINVVFGGQPGGEAQQITVSGGVATINFAGIPGYPYIVQRAENAGFTINLITVLTTNVPESGLFTCVDSTSLPQAYYRLKYNP
jgi:hypothetical protein